MCVRVCVCARTCMRRGGRKDGENEIEREDSLGNTSAMACPVFLTCGGRQRTPWQNELSSTADGNICHSGRSKQAGLPRGSTAGQLTSPASGEPKDIVTLLYSCFRHVGRIPKTRKSTKMRKRQKETRKKENIKFVYWK